MFPCKFPAWVIWYRLMRLVTISQMCYFLFKYINLRIFIYWCNTVINSRKITVKLPKVYRNKRCFWFSKSKNINHEHEAYWRQPVRYIQVSAPTSTYCEEYGNYFSLVLLGLIKIILFRQKLNSELIN